MMKGIARQWREFKDDEPGRRFENRYTKNRKEGGAGWKRALSIGAGFVVTAAGLVLLPAPGPGMLVVALGAGLIAQEFLWAAKGMDWLELRLRKIAAWAKRWWKKAPLPLRGLAVLVGLTLAGGAVFLAYKVFTSR